MREFLLKCEDGSDVTDWDGVAERMEEEVEGTEDEGVVEDVVEGVAEVVVAEFEMVVGLDAGEVRPPKVHSEPSGI